MEKRLKKAIGMEGFVFFILVVVAAVLMGSVMGVTNMFNTIMKTAHQLILNTVLFLMAIMVLAGAGGALLCEFGVIAIIQKVLSPLMKPVYDLPGAAALGLVTTYLSDNPAIIPLAHDKEFKRYFKRYQMPALTNLGTCFGMGLVVTTFMMAQTSPSGESFIGAALIGNLGAIVGGIISVRLMLMGTKKRFGKTECMVASSGDGDEYLNKREIRSGSIGKRFLEAMLEGGKTGVDMGLSVIPGVVIICTIVFVLSGGPSESGAYTGAAFEGVGVFGWLGNKIAFILKPLFGFQNGQAIAFPITSLGAVGAALGLVPGFLAKGVIGGNEIAVFTAIGMCWSGYLSTHVAMMDALGFRELTGRAIGSHTIGGLCGGITAHFVYLLLH
ncbi:MAG: CD0519/CD1768 family membrane protein [Candidatus Aminicenantales bacterium]